LSDNKGKEGVGKTLPSREPGEVEERTSKKKKTVNKTLAFKRKKEKNTRGEGGVCSKPNKRQKMSGKAPKWGSPPGERPWKKKADQPPQKGKGAGGWVRRANGRGVIGTLAGKKKGRGLPCRGAK